MLCLQAERGDFDEEERERRLNLMQTTMRSLLFNDTFIRLVKNEPIEKITQFASAILDAELSMNGEDTFDLAETPEWVVDIFQTFGDCCRSLALLCDPVCMVFASKYALSHEDYDRMFEPRYWQDLSQEQPFFTRI